MTRSFSAFFAIDSPNHSVILGIPWLRSTNPQIDWREGKISPNDPRLRPATIDLTNLNITLPVPEFQIPDQYKTFEHVFQKRQADKLPEHRSYDCSIELTEGPESFPKRKIYSLSLKEEEALREFIDDMRKKGFIRHSTSPLGAPVLFATKKDGSMRPCIDFCTKKIAYPIPVIRDVLQQLRRAKIYTKLDL
jgi:hypothetical protein